ncbi:YlaN family protein [Mechercharimyces sp. CAU 1602]|uniref:YlaN family protein n=1 Tax=Mechercharimyces sp. CAU 1602 TaxID=2973933 RepID=UPI0021637607|nr:YlaN family protein [Mechercharimyces sp. CAU 1602]MCS1350142.1 YlaN family protein [Mechercharimyces sp. CAU 1602]
MSTPIQADANANALHLLYEDAQKIEQLIAVQLDNLTLPKCPLYEEVLDTQMFGLSREIDFAVRAGLITREQGREIMNDLEKKLAQLFSLMFPKDQEANING